MNKQIKWNNNNLKSIKKAERAKGILENKGYTLKNQFVNSITGDCTFTYEPPITYAKLIEYAYPSSTTAKKAGYGKSGCWFVSLYESVNSAKKVEDIAYFAEQSQAERYADSLPNPYNFMHKYHNA